MLTGNNDVQLILPAEPMPKMAKTWPKLAIFRIISIFVWKFSLLLYLLGPNLLAGKNYVQQILSDEPWPEMAKTWPKLAILSKNCIL